MVELPPQRYVESRTGSREGSYVDLSSKLQARYKGEKQKFGGSPDENWSIALARYQRHSRELCLSAAQKVDFIHHMFRDDAEHFYYEELEAIRNWGDLVSTLNTRYNSYARKQAIADQVADLRLDDFTGSDFDEGEALQKLARQIEVLVPQAPIGENTDKDKRKALHHGVRKFVWAQPVINTLAYQPRKPYKEFLHELTAAEQNHRVAKELRASSNRHLRSRMSVQSGAKHRNNKGGSGSPSQAADIWYAGQAQLGLDPKAKKLPKVSSGSDRRCYNCGDKSHVVDRCLKPRDEVRILKGRLKGTTRGKDSKTTVRVLKEMLMEQAAHVNFLSDELCLRMSGNRETGSAGSGDSSRESDSESHGDSSGEDAQQAHFNAIAAVASRTSGYSIDASFSDTESSDGMDF